MSFSANANTSPIKIYGGTRQDLSNAGYEFSTLVGGETHYATRYIAGNLLTTRKMCAYMKWDTHSGTAVIRGFRQT